MLFDLRKIMLMIKDISELCKSCSTGVINIDWGKKRDALLVGVGEVKVILAQFL